MRDEYGRGDVAPADRTVVSPRGAGRHAAPREHYQGEGYPAASVPRARSPYDEPRTRDPYDEPGADEAYGSEAYESSTYDNDAGPVPGGPVRESAGASGYGPYASRDPYAARAQETRRRPVVEAPPQQPAYNPGEEGGGAVVSRRIPVDWFRWMRRVAFVIVGLLAALVVISVVSCALGGSRGVADAGSNAVGSQDLSGSKDSKGSGTSGNSAASTTGSDSSGEDTGRSSGSHAGDQTLGKLLEDAGSKLGSLDWGGAAEKLGDAANSLGDGLSDLAGAGSDLLGQLAR